MTCLIRRWMESERVLHKFWSISLHQTLGGFQLKDGFCLHADYIVYLSLLKDAICRC